MSSSSSSMAPTSAPAPATAVAPAPAPTIAPAPASAPTPAGSSPQPRSLPTDHLQAAERDGDGDDDDPPPPVLPVRSASETVQPSMLSPPPHPRAADLLSAFGAERVFGQDSPELARREFKKADFIRDLVCGMDLPASAILFIDDSANENGFFSFL